MPNKKYEQVNEIPSEKLDGLVHDCKSQEASSLNNAGTTSQLQYLKENFGLTDKDILDHINNGCD